jgi:precorrin-2 dehydrogenase / sirohydrochlorin ferrochelatase
MAIDSNERLSASSSYFPIGVDLRDRRVLVVGGGKQALPEVERLLEFGAAVDVVAQHVMVELSDLAKARGDQLKILPRRFGQTDVENLQSGLYLFVIGADNQPQENITALKAAKEAKTLGYNSTTVTGSQFTIPAVFKRGHLKVSVSTDGISPALEQAILSNLEAALSPELDKDAIFLNSLAEDFAGLSGAEGETEQQTVFLELAANEELRYALERRNFAEARQIVHRIFAESGFARQNASQTSSN